MHGLHSTEQGKIAHFEFLGNGGRSPGATDQEQIFPRHVRFLRSLSPALPRPALPVQGILTEVGCKRRERDESECKSKRDREDGEGEKDRLIEIERDYSSTSSLHEVPSVTLYRRQRETEIDK